MTTSSAKKYKLETFNLLIFIWPRRFWLDSHHYGANATEMATKAIAFLPGLKRLHPNKGMRDGLISLYGNDKLILER